MGRLKRVVKEAKMRGQFTLIINRCFLKTSSNIVELILSYMFFLHRSPNYLSCHHHYVFHSKKINFPIHNHK